MLGTLITSLLWFAVGVVVRHYLGSPPTPPATLPPGPPVDPAAPHSDAILQKIDAFVKAEEQKLVQRLADQILNLPKP